MRRHVAWLGLALAALGGELAAAGWKVQLGDDPRWAEPGFDDSGWRTVAFPATWSESGLAGVDGVVWFRGVARLDPAARLAATQDELGLLADRSIAGGYEIWAAGRLLGRSRGFEASLPFGRQGAFAVPREVVGQDGTVQLALRVWRVGWAADADPESAPVGDGLAFGFFGALEDRVRVAWTELLLSELPLFILAALFAVVSVYHLLLFVRRRHELQHLWFGLLALAFTLNTWASTYWIYEVTASRGLAVRMSDSTGHLAAALAIQFVWRFFALPIPRWLRLYQASHLALAAAVLVWPDERLVLGSLGVRSLWLLPLLLVSAWVILREAWRGTPQARTFALGGVAMIALQVLELARNNLPLAWMPPFSLAGIGFAAVLMAMGLSLSSRFRSVHDELDRLRLRLEDEVVSRTRALEAARQEALAADRAKSELLANVSHEIRTPMNGVLGMSELLVGTSLTATQREYVEAIRTSGRALLALINDILDFSRMESQRLTIDRAPFDPAAVVRESLELIAPLAAKQGLVLSSAIDPALPAPVVGDRDRTRQVLLNLLGNAVKFTPRGSVEVRVAASAQADGRFEIRFAVADTGIGIAPGELPRLFSPFHQVDGTPARRYGGAGLGLAISKRLAELMGGRIWAESSPGKGSTFHFTMVVEAAPPGLTADREPTSAVPAGGRPLRVLVAEDNEVNQLVLTALLQGLGHRADLVANGREALAALDRGAYDVILMDVQMPELDGLETTRRLRRREGAQPFVIALTAQAMAGDRERCLAAGMDSYLAKPVQLEALKAALEVVPR